VCFLSLLFPFSSGLPNVIALAAPLQLLFFGPSRLPIMHLASGTKNCLGQAIPTLLTAITVPKGSEHGVQDWVPWHKS
jgi:hypothetical protein